MSEYPAIKINGVYYLDTPEHQKEIKEKLIQENKALQEKKLEFEQKYKDLFFRLEALSVGGIDIIASLEDENQKLKKMVSELKQTCTELTVKMHTALNAYEMLKQHKGEINNA